MPLLPIAKCPLADGLTIVIDAALLLMTMAAPYLFAHTGGARAAVAAAMLALWFVVVRPTWGGLMGFYATALLCLHFLVWSALAVWQALQPVIRST